jgi:hypothetical protein
MAAGSGVLSRRSVTLMSPQRALWAWWGRAMHIADYIVIGFLVATMLLAATKALPRRNS